MNTPENMDAYLAAAFDIEQIRRELACAESTFFFLLVDSVLAGYLKANDAGAQSDLKNPRSLELERIYVDTPFQGRGMGRILIDKGLEVARRKGKAFVWLGVWEKNEMAIGFYEKSGFTRIGTHDFFMGDERQTDFIMRCDLA
jgi:ribosomal protein S18 acetylase RimI-like enzyme